MNRLASLLLALTLLIVGAAVGAGIVLLALSNAALVLDTTVTLGVAAGVASFVLFLLLRMLIGTHLTRNATRDASGRDTLAQIASVVLDKLGFSTEETRAFSSEMSKNGQKIIRSGLTIWSSTIALGLGITITGSVIAMVTAIAAVRQVERIDAQNDLIEQQNFEARASRAAEVFAAQLPSLLSAMDMERQAYFAEASQTEQIARRPEQWLPSRALQSRIQAVVDTAEPFVTDPEVDAAVDALNAEVRSENERISKQEPDGLLYSEMPKLFFSPQRGQLLRLIIGAGVDLSNVKPPFDFSQSDLRNVAIATRLPEGSTEIDLGNTKISNSNFFGSDISNVDLSGVDLQGSVFTSLAHLSFANTQPRERDEDNKLAGLTQGADLQDVILLRQPEPNQAESLGWLGHDGLSDTWDDPGILQFDATSAVFGRINWATLRDIVVKAEVNGRKVYRLGGLELYWLVSEPFIKLKVRMPKDNETCEDLDPNSLEEVRKLVWYAGQSTTHPKWRYLSDLVLRELDPFSANCARQTGQSTEMPEMAKNFLE